MVVTHKMSDMPKEQDLYVPTLVGENKNSLVYDVCFRDDVGENIARKNRNYCELTALYWAWKNLDADIIGLVHYRRAFLSKYNKNLFPTKNELEDILDKVDAILPKKRNYYIENTWSHYKHNHYEKDLMEVKNIIQNKYPNYIGIFDKVMKEKKSHRFNMLIMKKELLDNYCSWLFDILFELEKKIDISDYDDYQARVFGFISERLLDVWIDQNEILYDELPYKFLEKQNWIKKGSKFVVNKFGRGVQ
ncbi:DUF4422 domain-containing protein [Enterococcus gallinarum]|nr:DUF4422 domain-containing protein [Enterococcus gallinarum]